MPAWVVVAAGAGTYGNGMLMGAATGEADEPEEGTAVDVAVMLVMETLMIGAPRGMALLVS